MDLTFADRLNRLFESLNAPATSMEAVTFIRAFGAKMSGPYMSQLRSGRRVNPSLRTIKAIAEYFHVEPAYFLDDDYYAMIDARLTWNSLMHDDSVRRIGVGVSELSPETRDKVADLVDRLRHRECTDEPSHSTQNVTDVSQAWSQQCRASSTDDIRDDKIETLRGQTSASASN